MDEWLHHKALFAYDFVQYVPCVAHNSDCDGYLKPTGPPINDPKWGGGVKFPTRCTKCHINPTISLSTVHGEGMKLTWKEIRRLKNMLRKELV